MSLSRDFGDLSLGIAGSIVDSGQSTKSGRALGATTRQIAVSAGHAFGSLNLDSTLRLADAASILPTSLASGLAGTLASKGNSAGVGASLTDDLPFGRSTFLSPFVSVDYDRVDVARVVTSPRAPSFSNNASRESPAQLARHGVHRDEGHAPRKLGDPVRDLL